jgi:type I restriction enzyme S subunit
MADETELDDCRGGDSGLPEGWAYSEIGDLVGVTSGKFIAGHEYATEPGRPFPVAGAGGPIGWTDRANFTAPVMTLGRVGAAGTLRTYDTEAWVTDNALVILPDIAGFFDFLGLFFQTVRWSDLHTGSSQPLITQTLVKGLPIALPPLAEQKRLVAKVEELVAQVNAARGRLATVPAILKRFRQSVLAAACSGRLTADWREQHPDVEPASELLKRILAERLQKYEAKCEEAKAEGRKPPKRPGNLQLRNPDTNDCPELPELPENWMLITVNESAVLIQYGTSEKADANAEDGIAMLRMSNIQEGRLDLGHLKYLEWALDEAAPFLVEPADLLFNRTNSPELVGKAAVFDADLDAVFASYLVRVRTDEHMANSRFVCYWINSSWGREWAMMVKTDGVSQSNVNATKLADMPLPLPPRTEQDEIVRRVEALFALADKIEERMRAATLRAEKLTQAILAKAFRGELVPTEAELARREGREYEPAWVLLDRIRKQRAQTPPAKRSRRSASEKPPTG